MAVTFSTLITETPQAIQAVNSAIVAEMPAIIRRAEGMITSRINPDLFKKRFPLIFIDYGTRVVDLSADLTIMGPREVYVAYGRLYRPVIRRGRDYCRSLYPNDRAKDTPRFYAEAEPRVLEFFPFPKDGTQWEGMMNVKALPLGAGQDTNLFTNEVPLLLEHAVRMFASVWMHDQERAGTYSGLFEAELSEANNVIARRRRDEASERPRPKDNVAGATP